MKGAGVANLPPAANVGSGKWRAGEEGGVEGVQGLPPAVPPLLVPPSRPLPRVGPPLPPPTPPPLPPPSPPTGALRRPARRWLHSYARAFHTRDVCGGWGIREASQGFAIGATTRNAPRRPPPCPAPEPRAGAALPSFPPAAALGLSRGGRRGSSTSTTPSCASTPRRTTRTCGPAAASSPPPSTSSSPPCKRRALPSRPPPLAAQKGRSHECHMHLL